MVEKTQIWTTKQDLKKSHPGQVPHQWLTDRSPHLRCLFPSPTLDTTIRQNQAMVSQMPTHFVA